MSLEQFAPTQDSKRVSCHPPKGQITNQDAGQNFKNLI